MHAALALLGILLIAAILWDSFEAIVLPRRVTRQIRLTRYFYAYTWMLWRSAASRIDNVKRRETILGYFGPLSLLLLLMIWASSLVVGFALLDWSTGDGLNGPAKMQGYLGHLYMSGTNFFTLGIGDVTPATPIGRVLTVLECATGLGFLAVVVGYLPVIYQAFSRRETVITLLDSRAGSPPTAAELLRRHGAHGRLDDLDGLLKDWERWSADILESHLSYPVLSYYRSQHDNQSWLASLTAILDVCALLMAGVKTLPAWQARLTFAIARHAVVDFSQLLGVPPVPFGLNRLPPDELARLQGYLTPAGVTICNSEGIEQRLADFRAMYEPYINGLSERLLFRLPPWLPARTFRDNWETSAWEKGAKGLPSLELDDHD